LGFRVRGPEFRVFMVQNLRSKVWEWGFRVYSLGFRVYVQRYIV
jgi:hypothetical protein